MPVSKLVFIFVPVRELVWFPNSDWRVYLSFHSGSISAQTEILVWELGPSAQTGINESQFANWDPSSRTGTVRILGLTYIQSYSVVAANELKISLETHNCFSFNIPDLLIPMISIMSTTGDCECREARFYSLTSRLACNFQIWTC